MKKNIIYMAALTIMAAACSSEDETTVTSPEQSGKGEVKMITETIRATNGDGATRADIDASFAWSARDQIAVHVSGIVNGENYCRYYTTDPLNGGSAAATFTVTYPAGCSRDAFAVYPATIVAEEATNYGQSGAALDVTLPPSYTLAEVSGTTTPCPMIADNTGSGWAFYQLCGLLRLTVNNIPADATGIAVQFPNNKVNGTFPIASTVSPGSSVISTTTNPDEGEDLVTVTFDAGTTTATVNIPLPTGDYTNVCITPVGSKKQVAAVSQIKAGGYTAERAKGRKLTTTMVENKENYIIEKW